MMSYMRDLGKYIVPGGDALSARERILRYFCEYPFTVIRGEELLVISGIQEYARRVRELRVQFGWRIVSGTVAKQMSDEGELVIKGLDFLNMGVDDYILIDTVEDKESAHRWNVAHEIRRLKSGVREKILRYFRENTGIGIAGEELKYVAGDVSEWARRVRELRSEHGWPIVTKQTGRPDLAVGVYVLESDRRAPAHDRKIPDEVRRNILRRDGYKCSKCGWSHKDWNRSDPRHLELHHTKAHVEGGANSENNLKVLCTICHDSVHRSQHKDKL
jgi:hypothetical protein